MSDSAGEPASDPPRRPRWVEDAARLDLAVYAAIARTPTPALDRAMSRLSSAADYSRLSIASAALLALAGGQTGRRAAGMGLASLAVTAGVVNVAVVGYSRVHTGVHYPGDVLVGALMGTTLAQLTTYVGNRLV